MLIKAVFEPKSLEDYRDIIPKERYSQIEEYARKLKGIKVAHLNATQYGGGVAEILKSLVPLMESVGLNAQWYVIPQMEEFQKVLLTKKLHNSLQGGKEGLTKEEKESYINSSKALAEMAKGINPDIWVMHDPQALGSGYFLADSSKARILRVHIDFSKPNKDTWNFLTPYMINYDKIILHMEEYVPGGFPKNKIAIRPPAIDPLSKKNVKMDPEKAKKIVADHGIDPAKPLLVNISRFDRQKDSIGMISAYTKAKSEIPDLQFALVGLLIASDDPEAKEYLEEVKQYAKGIDGLFLFSDLKKIRSDEPTFVGAFQSAADIVIHKSIYEGFGLVVTEAMIKGKPVVAGNAGGIKLQIKDGENGFLVNSVDEAAKCIVKLMKDPQLRKKSWGSCRKKRQREFPHSSPAFRLS